MENSPPLNSDLSILGAAYEHSPVGVMILGRNSLIRMVNPSVEKLTGFSRAHLEEKQKLSDLVLPDDQQKLKKLLRMIKAGDEDWHNSQECRLVDKQGQMLTVSLSGTHLSDAGVSILFLQNITAQKETETILQDARARAETSERLKTTFLGNLSHEIRTPMNAIVGFASLLQADHLSEDKKKVYLGQIINGSSDLLQLIEKTIILSRIDLGHLKINQRQFFVNRSLASMGEKFRKQLEEQDQKPIELILENGRKEEDFVIQADQVRVQEVLNHLVDNAIKFTSEGSITLGYAYLEEEMDNGEDALLYYVKDTGQGISVDKQGIVFDRFVKLVEKNETILRGAGLGLAIARELVRLMGGELWVESHPGEGSKFFFTLPITYSRVVPSPPESESRRPQARENWRKHTFLIAEDVEFNYLYIKELISSTGVSILRARDGLEAVEIFEKHPEIDLVLMDILMPGLDGYEATAKIREIRPDIPVIAQTAFTFEGEIQNGLYAGCFNDYIMKPFTRDMLLGHVKKHLPSDGD